MVRIFIFLVIVEIFSQPKAWSAGKNIKAKVELFPLGSFIVSSDSILGKLKKIGSNRYESESIRVEVKTLKTGINLRDSHLKDKLDQEKYPYITASKVVIKGGKGGADLNIMNVSQKIKVNVVDVRNESISLRFEIDLAKFNIDGISYKGVGVEDGVQVWVTIPVEN